MFARALESICFDPAFGRQMRFIVGPRQVGKTTLAKTFLKGEKGDPLYYNWDRRAVRTRFRQETYFFHSDALQNKTRGKRWICFDEIHKYPKWKNVLKDFFDSFEEQYRFIITGSARLDFFRKSGDSLSGRYFLFRLLPLSLFEILNRSLSLPSESAQHFIEANIQSRSHQSDLEHLLQFSGFPEPLSKGNAVFHSHWHEEYMDTLLKEDLRDLTRIQEMENVATMLSLLPHKIGTPLSLNSLKGDMEVSYNAVKNYMRSLILTYILFLIPPYSKKIQRSIRKEKKVYFFDWTQVPHGGKRFENYVACELKNRTQLWSAATQHKFELYFVRNREGKETDFLITRNNTPYFLMEAKESDENMDSHHYSHAKVLGAIPFVQLVRKPDVVKAGKDKTYIVSASRFF